MSGAAIIRIYISIMPVRSRKKILARNLQVSIQQCEANGRMVPPGLYGEYGYLLYETGHYGEAVAFFSKGTRQMAGIEDFNDENDKELQCKDESRRGIEG